MAGKNNTHEKALEKLRQMRLGSGMVVFSRTSEDVALLTVDQIKSFGAVPKQQI